MMKINKPSIKGDADLENSIAITCDIVIIIFYFIYIFFSENLRKYKLFLYYELSINFTNTISKVP